MPLPPTKAEQEAIAEALSDADALIESLEQLIAKKRQIKQGAMQELLTGKRRLPGFGEDKGYKQTEVGVIPEDWDIQPADEICKVNQGQQIAIRTVSIFHLQILRSILLDVNISTEGKEVEYTDTYSPISSAVIENDVLMTRTW